MANLSSWFSIALAVTIAALANAISAQWAASANKFSLWLPAMLAISPLVFVTFGQVAAKNGLAIAAGIVDASLVIATMLIGLVLFREWSKVTGGQYLGMALSVAGILLMLYARKA
jgi:hypothetical protein